MPGLLNMSYPRTIAFLIGLLTLLSAASGAQARYYRHGNSSAVYRQHTIQMAQAQLATARRASAAAEAQMAQAQNKIDADNNRIRGGKSSLDSAKSQERTSHDELQSMQAELIEKQGSKSEIAKAQAELLDSEEQIRTQTHRVLGSDEFKAQAEKIDLSERLTRLPAIREAALAHDEDYQVALVRYRIAHVKFGQLRMEMVRNSPEWMAVSEEVREAWKDQNKAQMEITTGAMARLGARHSLRDAQAVYASAQQLIAQSEFVLRRLGVNPPPPPPPPKTGSASGS